MAGDKYRSRAGNKDVLKQARQTGDPAHAGNLVALGDNGFLNEELFPPEAQNGTVYPVEISVSLPSSCLVNLYDVSGVTYARPADYAEGKPAHGFSHAGELELEALVHFHGTFASGLEIAAGTEMFLFGTGGATETPDDTAGFFVQSIGFAVEDNKIRFVRGVPTPMLAS